jgi:hypothetical protein
MMMAVVFAAAGAQTPGWANAIVENAATASMAAVGVEDGLLQDWAVCCGRVLMMEMGGEDATRAGGFVRFVRHLMRVNGK